MSSDGSQISQSSPGKSLFLSQLFLPSLSFSALNILPHIHSPCNAQSHLLHEVFHGFPQSPLVLTTRGSFVLYQKMFSFHSQMSGLPEWSYVPWEQVGGVLQFYITRALGRKEGLYYASYPTHNFPPTVVNFWYMQHFPLTWESSNWHLFSPLRDSAFQTKASVRHAGGPSTDGSWPFPAKQSGRDVSVDSLPCQLQYHPEGSTHDSNR